MRKLAACLALVVMLLPSVTEAGGTDLRKLFHKPHLALPQGFPEGFEIVPCTHAFNLLAARPFACGPFQVTQFRYVSTRPGRLSQVNRLATRHETAYSFRIEVGRSLAWEGLCREAKAVSATVLESGRSSVEIPNLVVSAVRCELRDAVTLQAWTLDLRTDIVPYLVNADVASAGSLVSGEAHFAVVESHAIDGLDIPSEWPIGFLFSRDGCWIAAADAGTAGSLRLDPASERGPIAAASAALLLHAALANVPLAGGE
jgi:hypothetical protein